MRVRVYLADQNPARDKSRGITAYSDGLLRRLAGRDDVAIEALASRSSYAGCPGIAVRRLPLRSDHPLPRLAVDQLHPWLAGWLGAGGADLVHYPKGFLPLALRPGAPLCGTVHDVIVDWYAERLPVGRARAVFAFWRAVLLRSLARFDAVLTVSEHARRGIEALCRRRGVRCPPLHVTGQGCRYEDLPWSPAKKEDVVVHLGSVLPHKGTDTLLAHWAQLEERVPELPELLVVGSLEPRQQRRLAALRRGAWLPALPEERLRATLATARALVLPSEIEGFGLPALEACLLGTPVVYVAGTAVEEVLGTGAPGAFQSGSAESLGAALEEVLELPEGALRARAEALRRRHAWADCAERTLAAWRSLP